MLKLTNPRLRRFDVLINSNVKFVNLESISISNLSYEKLTIHSGVIKLHRIRSLFVFSHKVKSILYKAMLSKFQIHFLSPEHNSHYILQFNSKGLKSRPSFFNQLIELNFWNSNNSSLGLKAEVSLRGCNE